MYGYRSDGKAIQTQIYINIYDLQPPFNSACYNLGLGFYHSGLQIGTKQYTFGGHAGSHSGVMEVPPKVNHPNFRQSILVGTTTMSYKQIYRIIDELKDKFAGNSYHLIRKNCNTFTNAVSQAILKKSIPGYVNRLAKVGKFFLEMNDFFQMKAYNPKYEICPNQLGIKSKGNQNVFQKKQGVMIGE